MSTRQFKRYALDELFDCIFYRRMAKLEKDPRNRAILEKLSEEERQHYLFWSSLSGPVELSTWDKLRLRLALLSGRLLGRVFTVKLLERHEKAVIEEYRRLLSSKALPQDAAEKLARILRDEEEHEASLAGQIEETRVRYLGSLALGMSDAIIELSGVHAGFLSYTASSLYTGIAGLIVGVSASMSMAAAAYLQAKQEPGKAPAVSAATTGLMYVATVLVLTAPFLAGLPLLAALAASLSLAFLVLAMFTFYSSVIRETSFLRDYVENVLVILLVVAAGYAFGGFVKNVLGFEV
ncbi:MAG: VIT1/CCC1 family protein [Thermofilum sp.]